MSTFLTAQSLTLTHTSTPLFKAISFTIQRGDKVGLVGHNGCGKSSLLKLLNEQIEATEGQFSKAKHCLMSYVEQHIPETLHQSSVISALQDRLVVEEFWRAEVLLEELGFNSNEWQMRVVDCSGGQQMRLLLARAIITQPDLILLDEPSNHLDLPSLMWLEKFLQSWKGSFVLVSHDQKLLDSVTNTTWIMRDQSLHHFSLPCSQARQALIEKDETDKLRHQSEQKEIDRIEKSAKRLATWGKVYDNEDLARKAKTMFARKERLEEEQTELTEGTPWSLVLKGDSLPANRLLEITSMSVTPYQSDYFLFDMQNMRVKSGDRIAVLGSNGSGKTTLLEMLNRTFDNQSNESVRFHDRCRLGYYDQSLQQLKDEDTIFDALYSFASMSNDDCKHALISAGFEYARHAQTVESLSGGERARLLFVGLTLARYHLLFLDEPTNHLDMEGKEELIETLNDFEGATLIVSHDRTLIEQGCNRFWFIQNGKLIEYLSVDEVYQQIEVQSDQPSIERPQAAGSQALAPVESISGDEALLERLIELECLLDDDLKRRPKHQKLKLQQEWRDEIERISMQLE